MPWILLHQTWQMNLLWLMNLLSTRAEMTCIPLHQTWQMNLLWLNKWQRFESSSIHHFWDTPQHFLKTHFCLESGFLSLLELQKSLLVSRVIENWCIEYCYTKLGRWTYYGWWTAPSTRAEMTCIPLHKTWQMNLLWLNTMAKVWKLQHSPFLRYFTAFFQNTLLLRTWLSFIARAPEIPASK